MCPGTLDSASPRTLGHISSDLSVCSFIHLFVPLAVDQQYIS